MKLFDWELTQMESYCILEWNSRIWLDVSVHNVLMWNGKTLSNRVLIWYA